MEDYIIALLCNAMILVVAVIMRCWLMKRVSARQVKSVESPLSRAIQATVGYAGGIYMTLVMLVSFLQVEVPEKIIVMNRYAVEPLAFIAVVLAFLQPFFLVIWDIAKKR